VSTILGVELGPGNAWAVTIGSWQSKLRKTAELPWDPERPDALVSALRQQFGKVDRIALAFGLAFLHVKHVKLPPAPALERKRILALEPDRFFPVQDEALVVALVNEENFAFAVDAELLERCIAAFERWATVEMVEPAPGSLARALGKTAQGSFVVAAAADEHGVVELHDGRVRSARRMSAAAEPPAAKPIPVTAGIAGDYVIAFGAARGVDADVELMLLGDERVRSVQQRRLRRFALTAAVCFATFLVALWAVDRSRERTLQKVRDEIAALSPRAAGALQLSERLSAVDRESSAIAELTGRRINPLLVLAALSEHLPEGVTVLNLRATGDQWQVDGTARDAAALVPLLDRDERFQDVRFLSASARFREGDRTYETFSIAFRVRPAT
jgi:Tfp pilus assembly protein PilN